MLTRHVSRRLAAYVDGQLRPTERQAVEAHLAACERCRTELDEVRFASALVRRLTVAAPPSSLWESIDAAVTLRRAQGHPEHSRGVTASGSRHARGAGTWSIATGALRWALAAMIPIVLAVGAYWYSTRTTTQWEVRNLDGGGIARMAAGEWIETNTSRARITVGRIGTVDVEPDTRVRLGEVRTDEYRIALARGTISAQITAPPRLFFVDTPTSTVVDLGCAYTMHVDDAGAGELRVTQGWASLEWNGRESLVPAGARGRTQPGAGPGTPYFEDAPLALQNALAEFDFANGGVGALDTVLAESRVRDTLTLWHLMSRVEEEDRARVFDRIAGLVPPPETVSREKALALDPATLKNWREELAWKW